MADDRPDSFDQIIGQSRPQQGEPPRELNDPRNYLVFDRLPSAGPLDDAATTFTTDREGRPAVSDPGTVLGVVVRAVEPVTPEYVASELAKMRAADDSVGREGSAYIPDWTAVSGMPTLAPSVDLPPGAPQRDPGTSGMGDSPRQSVAVLPQHVPVHPRRPNLCLDGRDQTELDRLGHGLTARRPHDPDRQSRGAVGFVELEGTVRAGLLRRRFDPRRVGASWVTDAPAIPRSRSR